MNLIYTGNHITLQLNNCLKKKGITLQQFNVLRILRGQKGKSLNLFEIQERMINKNSNTTRLIDKLLKKEFVLRHVDSENRRKINVSITSNGLEFLSELDTIIDEQEEPKLLKKLSIEDQKQLNVLLEKLYS